MFRKIKQYFLKRKEMKIQEALGLMSTRIYRICPECRGSGKVSWRPYHISTCNLCVGKMKITEKEYRRYEQNMWVGFP